MSDPASVHSMTENGYNQCNKELREDSECGQVLWCTCVEKDLLLTIQIHYSEKGSLAAQIRVRSETHHVGGRREDVIP